MKNILTNWTTSKRCTVCEKVIEADEELFDDLYARHVIACQDNFMKEQKGDSANYE